MTISLCMIVKNEEEVLENCLESIVGIVDEIIIVDTGSTDGTIDIAKKYTDSLYHFEWIDDFSAARNYAFSLATKEYILWLDADDVLLVEDYEKLKEVKQSLSVDVDVVSMYYHIAFDEAGNPTFKYRRNRLVKRERDFKWHGVVHEYLAVSGKCIDADIAITHEKSKKAIVTGDNQRNLKIYEKKLQRGEAFTARDMFYFANELKDHRYFERAIRYYRKFLKTEAGWIEDIIRAYINMAACYKEKADIKKELEALMMSIVHDVPRPEVSCRLGDYYKEKGELKKAVLWYCLALDVDMDHVQGFQLEAFATWYPHMQLCYCYYQLDEKILAYAHHLRAKEYRPNDAAVLYNEAIFANMKTETT